MTSEQFEVVWNGAIDRAFALSKHREPAPEVRFNSQIALARGSAFIEGSIGDRLLKHMAERQDAEHTTDSIAAALGVSRTFVGTYLRRAWAKGYVVRVETTAKTKLGRELAVYRLVDAGRPPVVYRAAEAS